jgi:hypothetical protein
VWFYPTKVLFAKVLRWIRFLRDAEPSKERVGPAQGTPVQANFNFDWRELRMRALPGYLVILFFVFAARPTQSHRRPQISHQRRRRKERQRNAPAQSLEQEIDSEVADVFGQKWNLQLSVTPAIPKLIKETLFDF